MSTLYINTPETDIVRGMLSDNFRATRMAIRADGVYCLLAATDVSAAAAANNNFKQVYCNGHALISMEKTAKRAFKDIAKQVMLNDIAAFTTK
jgi:hypothetical protein